MADVRPHEGGWAEHPKYSGCHHKMDFPHAVSRIFRRPSSTDLLKRLWHSGRSGDYSALSG
jgi:hypothetical protein